MMVGVEQQPRQPVEAHHAHGAVGDVKGEVLVGEARAELCELELGNLALPLLFNVRAVASILLTERRLRVRARPSCRKIEGDFAAARAWSACFSAPYGVPLLVVSYAMLFLNTLSSHNPVLAAYLCAEKVNPTALAVFRADGGETPQN